MMGKQRHRRKRVQRGGIFPLFAIPAAAIAIAKAGAAAAGLGMAGAAGHQIVDSIANKIRGGGKRRRGQRLFIQGVIKQKRFR